MCKPKGLCGKSIEMWSMDVRIGARAQGLVAPLIGNDK